VRHHYAPLATFTRHGEVPDQSRITDIEDLRTTLGGAARNFGLPQVALSGTNEVHLGGVRLPASSHRSKHLVILSGRLVAVIGGGGVVHISFSYYTDEMTDPQTDPATGRIGNRTHAFSDETLITPVVLTRLTSGPSFLDEGLLNAQGALPPTPTPTSVPFFVQYLQASGEVRRVNLTATVLELS
jgi:hypothetical protein